MTNNDKTIFIVITSLAIGVRLIGINQSLWLDEAITAETATSFSLSQIINVFGPTDFNPPLHYLLVKLFVSIFGNAEFVLRLPSLLAGVASTWMMYLLSVSLINSKNKIKLARLQLPIKFIPMLLMALSGLGIYYSQEARVYQLSMTLVLWVSCLMLNQKLNQKSTQTSILLVLSITASLMSHYLVWFMLPIWFFYKKRETTLGFLLSAWWWPILSKQMQTARQATALLPDWSNVLGEVSFKNISLIPVKFLIGRISIEPDWLYAISAALPLLLVLMVAALAIRQFAKKPNSSDLYVLAWISVPVLLTMIVSLFVPMLSYFRLLFVLPACYLIFSKGLTHVSGNKIRSFSAISILVVTFLSSMTYLSGDNFKREDWKSLVIWVNAQEGSSKAVLFPSLAQAAAYNYYGPKVQAVDKVEAIDYVQVVYLIDYVADIVDPEGFQTKMLSDMGYYLIDTKEFNGLVVKVYQRQAKLYALFSSV